VLRINSMTPAARQKAIRDYFKLKGGLALENARQKIMQHYQDPSEPSQALRYFARVTLRNPLPIFPALASISCEAVGGNMEAILPFAQALVLISGAADIHDDVIDQSPIKRRKQTVMGKFGANIAILSGDTLLVEGFKDLIDATEPLPPEQSKEIRRLVSDAVAEICSAEALEIKMHRKFDIDPDDFLEVFHLKAVVPEVAMKIGAIIGKGSEKDVTLLGHYGRIFGVNSLIIEEFADLLTIDELSSRYKNECLPLPVIYAFQNSIAKEALLPMLEMESLDKRNHQKVVNIVLDSEEIKSLIELLIRNTKDEIGSLSNFSEKIRGKLQELLLTPLEPLRT
jgi:geranylgeranyl pyrophosphate synthase